METDINARPFKGTRLDSIRGFKTNISNKSLADVNLFGVPAV